MTFTHILGRPLIANVIKITAKIGLAANLLNLKDLMRTKDNCLRDGNNR